MPRSGSEHQTSATLTPAVLLLFDIDGTLMLSGGAGMRAMDDAFQRIYGVPEASRGIHPDGKTDPAIVREMISQTYRRDPDAGEIERMLAGYLAALAERMKTADVRIMPGLPRVLDSARSRGDVLGLATGNLEAGARIKLTRAGLIDYFRPAAPDTARGHRLLGGFACDHEGRTELTRAGVERGILAATPAVPRDHVVVIGDTPRDVAAARGAGVKVIAVATGRHTLADLEATSPDAAVATLENLDAVLDRLRG